MLNKSLKGAAAVTLACGLGALGASPALAASTSQVDVGINASAIPGAKVFGNTPAKTAESVSFVFKAQHLAQLEQQADSGFNSFLSVSQFAADYGQPNANVAALRNYLAGYGITTVAYKNNLDVSASGTAGDFNKALSVTQKQYSTPAVSHAGSTPIPAQTFHGVSSSATLPASIANNLEAIFGLTNYQPSVSNAKHTLASGTKNRSASSSSSCLAATGVPDDCNLPSDFESEYGLSSLYKSGATGRGQTLGIITFATVDKGAPQTFWSTIAGVHRTGSLSYDQVDGGAGAPSYDAGTGETDLDIEQSGSVAPGANIIVYEAPNSDAGAIDALFTVATQNLAGSVSQSWGEAETVIESEQAEGAEASGYITAFDEGFLELDAQGQANFVSSGDGGAYDAYGEFPPGGDQPTNISVDNPGDSPYTTSSGGTTLPWSADLGPSADGTISDVTINVPQQRTWGWDYLWKPLAELNGTDELTAAEGAIGGSGGGFAQLEPEPSYQYGVRGTNTYTAVPYLTPTDYSDEFGIPLPTAWLLNPSPPTIAGASGGRATPDLSADADPYTGYIEYAPSDAGQDGIASATQPGWGGTSFVAPELNGSAAVIDSALGGRTGLWNPSIYRFAQSRNTPFTPLDTPGTSNDNLYYSGAPGATFNPGSGLGIPNLSRLEADFASAG
ncbi:MAG TPA: protease pro-enzyme activation domain-containing protein [Solirubrobacteraceae bacterium]|nr:protease pro-enzyme activation domain-containing protein [Solirubrobacteraceae bacterium]